MSAIATEVTMSLVAAAPASATAPGKKGDMFANGQFLYICIATNTWIRTDVVTW